MKDFSEDSVPEIYPSIHQNYTITDKDLILTLKGDIPESVYYISSGGKEMGKNGSSGKGFNIAGKKIIIEEQYQKYPLSYILEKRGYIPAKDYASKEKISQWIDTHLVKKLGLKNFMEEYNPFQISNKFEELTYTLETLQRFDKLYTWWKYQKKGFQITSEQEKIKNNFLKQRYIESLGRIPHMNILFNLAKHHITHGIHDDTMIDIVYFGGNNGLIGEEITKGMFFDFLPEKNLFSLQGYLISYQDFLENHLTVDDIYTLYDRLDNILHYMKVDETNPIVQNIYDILDKTLQRTSIIEKSKKILEENNENITGLPVKEIIKIIQQYQIENDEEPVDLITFDTFRDGLRQNPKLHTNNTPGDKEYNIKTLVAYFYENGDLLKSFSKKDILTINEELQENYNIYINKSREYISIIKNYSPPKKCFEGDFNNENIKINAYFTFEEKNKQVRLHHEIAYFNILDGQNEESLSYGANTFIKLNNRLDKKGEGIWGDMTLSSSIDGLHEYEKKIRDLLVKWGYAEIIPHKISLTGEPLYKMHKPQDYLEK